MKSSGAVFLSYFILNKCFIIIISNFREEHELLEAVQATLVVHPLTAPILGNDHREFRGRENQVRKI